MELHFTQNWIKRTVKEIEEIEECCDIGPLPEDVMLIKNGTILLTDEDMKEYREGRVSDRLRDSWGLSFDELRHYIENNNYEDVNNDRNSDGKIS